MKRHDQFWMWRSMKYNVIIIGGFFGKWQNIFSVAESVFMQDLLTVLVQVEILSRFCYIWLTVVNCY